MHSILDPPLGTIWRISQSRSRMSVVEGSMRMKSSAIRQEGSLIRI